MLSLIRIATANLENLDDPPRPRASEPTLDERIALMRPQLRRVNADILCIQEAHGRRADDDQPHRLKALNELLKETRYLGFNAVSTLQTDDVDPLVGEDVAAIQDVIPAILHAQSVNPQRNLVVLTRFPVLAARQMKHRLAPAPFYKTVTSLPPDDEATAVTWERPILYVKLELDDGKPLHLINVHLKSKNPVNIRGQKEQAPGQNFEIWKTAAGRAEGSFLAAMQRVGQALEVRRLIDSLFEADEDARIVACGDFNADQNDVPMTAIRGDVEDTENPKLAKRVMVLCEQTIPEPARFSLIHRGRREMLDHILVSRTMLEVYKGTEIHNEVLHDESSAFATDKKFPESDHAPVIAEFGLPAT